jgi:hypothetical protein
MGFKSGGRRRKITKAPATVHFTTEKNDDDHDQPCIYVWCQFTDIKIGPVWGHGDASVKRALATLTKECDCPARFHSKRETEGFRLTGN